MRRRRFLASVIGATAGALGLGAGTVGSAVGHTGTPGTPPEGTVTGSGAGPHSRLSLPDAAEAVVGDDGTTVYVATMDGFAVVDVGDPHDPTLLAQVESILENHEEGPMRNIQDVKVDGDRLLVVGPGHPRQVVAAAVAYDVSDPANPQQVAVHETDYPIHNAFVRDGLAYLCANGAEGNPIVILDVEDDLAERGRWSVFDVDDAWRDVASSLRVIHDVWVQDDLAYLAYWDAGTWVLDVSDPGTPTLVSRVRGRDPSELASIEDGEEIQQEATERPGNDHYVTLDDDGTLLGIGVEAWDVDGDGEGGPGGITFYDVADPAEPTEVGSIEPPETPDPSLSGVWTTSHNFELTDGHCYSSWYQGGVRVHDVRDPSDPTEVYAWRDASTTRFWTAQRGVPGECFVAPSMGLANHPGTPPGEGSPAGTATEGEDAPAEPALYVFPDPVEGPTPTPTAAPTAERPVTDSATGPGFGPLAAIAGIGGLAAGLWWCDEDE